MKALNKALLLLLPILGVSAAAANLTQDIKVSCRDASGRFSLQDFKGIPDTALGNLKKIIDARDRVVQEVGCGVHSDAKQPIFIACVSKHLGDSDTVSRVRIHRSQNGVPSLAVLEFQSPFAEQLHISSVIPLICD